MVFSISEVVLYRGSSPSGEPTTYGDYEFVLTPLDQGQVWTTKISGQEVQFQSLPTQVGYLEIDPVAIGLLKGAQQVVLTNDMNQTPENAGTIDYAKLELGLAIPKAIPAMLNPDERYKLPVINCSRATPQSPVLIFNVTNDTSLRAYGSCIVLNAEFGDILRVKDRIIYEYYGILRDGQVVD